MNEGALLGLFFIGIVVSFVGLPVYIETKYKKLGACLIVLGVVHMLPRWFSSGSRRSPHET